MRHALLWLLAVVCIVVPALWVAFAGMAVLVAAWEASGALRA